MFMLAKESPRSSASGGALEEESAATGPRAGMEMLDWAYMLKEMAGAGLLLV